MTNCVSVFTSILKSHFVFLTVLLFVFSSCRKEHSAESEPNIIPKNVLSKEDPDFASRLAAIKEKFYSDELEEKLIPNVKQDIVWIPDWENPNTQIVNDSVSYVLYPLIGKYSKNGKSEKAMLIGGKPYLMVKNEKEFYRAFYYSNDNSLQSMTNPTELKMDNFTGKLLLSSLTNRGNYLLDYVNGEVSYSYKDLQKRGAKKANGMRGKLSYIETQCHTEMRNCTFVSDWAGSCSGSIIVLFSPTCNWPQSICGTSFSLTDSSEITVCEDIWFPDPPTDPGSGGGGTGGTSTGYEVIINVTDPCILEGVRTSINARNTIREMLNATFTGSDFESRDVSFYDVTTLPNNIMGTTHPENTMVFTINLNKNVLPDRSKEYIVSTVYHEILHAYLMTKYPIGTDGKFIMSDDHAQMADEYIALLTGALKVAFPQIGLKDAWALSWGGLEATPYYNKKLSAAERTEIEKINSQHRKTAPVAERKGTYCN
ncbi:SprT-like domain-containing protein [Pedobacter steynii]|uniref:Uncharacterized protein n=1 Tax=Pedobacter steynii TaxID=430522 RepID=A0A1D7QFC5_9SPHI|nr:SprT-like domain-containing protein [Pedobacter steynii]AOM77371.1 hypothetical protein BFS30_09460 [Pedobacter steynii]